MGVETTKVPGQPAIVTLNIVVTGLTGAYGKLHFIGTLYPIAGKWRSFSYQLISQPLLLTQAGVVEVSWH